MKDILKPSDNPGVIREESPERFLKLLTEVSGMTLMGRENQRAVPREAALGGVLGVVVVGSSTNSESNPKDLDTFIMLAGKVNPAAERFAQELSQQFDLEYAQIARKVELGRLDLGRGFIEGKPNQPLPEQLHEIQRAGKPLIYAYDEESAKKIEKRIESLKHSSQTH